MTLSEFQNYNETKSMPKSWIGQGYGYKQTDYEWDNGDYFSIIYIPEYGYDDDGFVERGNAYSKQDFIDVCCGNENIAHELFNQVDWQFPTTLYDEWTREEE